MVLCRLPPAASEMQRHPLEIERRIRHPRQPTSSHRSGRATTTFRDFVKSRGSFTPRAGESGSRERSQVVAFHYDVSELGTAGRLASALLSGWWLPCRHDRKRSTNQRDRLGRSISNDHTSTFSRHEPRLTLIATAVGSFIGPAGCHVERVEARESRVATRVIVRPVGTAVSVPRVALHQDEKEMIVVGSRERLGDGVVVQPINEPIVVTAAVGTPPQSGLGTSRMRRQWAAH